MTAYIGCLSELYRRLKDFKLLEADKPVGPRAYVEEYRPGYPRYSALISAHDSYFIYRRFCNLRARMLLLKQDKLSQLEEQLHRLDEEEVCPVFLGKNRWDRNTERMSLLSEIDLSMADYGRPSRLMVILVFTDLCLDSLIERTQRILGASSASSRDVTSLRNWVEGNGCLAREETAYLTYDRELISLAAASDSALTKLEVWIEKAFIRFYRSSRADFLHDLSNDPNVYLYSSIFIKRTARALLLFLIAFILLLPVIICSAVNSSSLRMIIVVFFTIFYLLLVALLAKSRTMEMILAGATYATLLIVFVAGSNGDVS